MMIIIIIDDEGGDANLYKKMASFGLSTKGIVNFSVFTAGKSGQHFRPDVIPVGS